MVVGLVVVAAALSFAVSTYRGVDGNKLREEVYRNGRFVGMSLYRDVQMAGVGIESQRDFGTLNTFGDTLMVLRVPFEPTMAPAHSMWVPPLSPDPLPPGGTCGATCIDFEYDASGSFDFRPGDLARLQSATERRLLLIRDVRDLVTRFQVTFVADTLLLDHRAAFAGGLQLSRSGTSLQKLQPVLFFVNGTTLFRSMGFDTTGVLQSSPMAYGVRDWDTALLFVDGDTAAAGSHMDADLTNDFDDLLGVLITAELGTNRPDIRVADGGVFSREFEWSIMPRNLMYERNR